MIYTSQTESTTGRCGNCNRHSPASANFCRWCGFNHSQAVMCTPASEGRITDTTVLGHDQEAPRSFSRLPLDTLSVSVATKTGALRLNRYGALAMAVLIAFPMWLLIVLLSPFDAYLSAKAAWSQMNIR